MTIGSTSAATDMAQDPTVVARATTALGRELPTWLVAGLAGSAVAVATAGAVGTTLLAIGWYRPAVVGGSALVAAAAAGFAAVRGLGRRVNADHRAALVALGLVVVFFGFASALRSEHLLTDRDPAVYLSSGRSIARTHELTPEIPDGPFKSPEFGNVGNRYGSNFFPMLPVILAVGWSIGGESGMLLVGPVLGCLGLLACYALAARVLGPRRGLVALAILIVAPLQLWFARDAYSELIVQLVALTGLWLYLETRGRGRWGLGALAGALVASSALARIDALAIVIACVGLVAAEWLRADSDPVPMRARRVVAAFGVTLVVCTAGTFVVTHKLAAGYIKALGDEYRPLVAVLVAAVFGMVAVVVAHRLRPGFGHWLATRRYLFGLAVIASVGVFAWAYVGRPDPVRDLPIVIRYPITDAIRTSVANWHYSRSLHWFASYFGLAGIVLAFAGFVLLAASARRGNGAAATLFLVVVPMTVLYLARPSIAPDQPWAMRRYLPVVIPGIAIAMVVAIESVWRFAREQRGAVARGVAVAIVGVAVLAFALPTANAARPFVRARVQHGAAAAINGLCRVAGPDGAVLVYGHAFLNNELPQPISAFCGVPVGTSSTVDIPALARTWHGLGRRLVVVTAVPESVVKLVPSAKVAAHLVVSDDHDIEKSFDHAPRRDAPAPMNIWILEIPVGAG